MLQLRDGAQWLGMYHMKWLPIGPQSLLIANAKTWRQRVPRRGSITAFSQLTPLANRTTSHLYGLVSPGNVLVIHPRDLTRWYNVDLLGLSSAPRRTGSLLV